MVVCAATATTMTVRKKTGTKAPGAWADAGIIQSRESFGKTAGVEETARPSAADFPIVGIGASAGGLAAFEAFFSGMPIGTDPDMAFVLVQHLAPDHKSILTDLIQRHTRMKVFEVEDGMTVQANCTYIIPPGRDMAFLNGRLKLLTPSAASGQRLPIDFFFRSLARDQRERAICVVLSGTGSDGTQGVRSIKGEGGMVMAQSPDSTVFDGMPRSAIATGLVDYQLLPAEMPAQLIAYAAHASAHPAPDASGKPLQTARTLPIQGLRGPAPVWPGFSTTAINSTPPPVAGRTTMAGRLSLRELTEQALLRQVAPTGALVDGNGDILYLHGRTGMYLEPVPGESGVNNILDMAREGLRRELTIALRKAVAEKEIVRRSGLLVKTNGDYTAVNLTICPLASRPELACSERNRSGKRADPAKAGLFLVIIEEALAFNPGRPQQADASDSDDASGPDASTRLRENARIATLRQELWAKEEYLRSANEELKASNEELQSVIEELQSSNEELETSREEMQSINEELATVNAELQIKVDDLARANSDMNNLLAGIATVIVDNNLRILRFTPDITRIINLINSDIGRPVGQIVSNLTDYDGLVADARAVLDTLVPREMEVQTGEGRRYIMRIRPYRTPDNAIEGAVITFVDISDSRRAQDEGKKPGSVQPATESQ